ncbi:hypothetical protein CDV36_014030 [Fusarium kuroshium]|uniref:Uncharacterized protein n=2 Tax=Fusarium solani species complex TaxID=232080 RepID=A0A3M2RIX5_9HYPO|nr:hypothetical protein CDV36_014030 [Fusarium kuroshium]
MEGLNDLPPFSSDNPRSSHADLPKPTIKVSPLRTSNSSAPYQREPGEGKRPSHAPRTTRHFVSYVEDVEESDYSDSIPANTGSKRSSEQGRYQQGFQPPSPKESARYYGPPGLEKHIIVPNHGVKRERTYKVHDVQYSGYDAGSDSTKRHSPHGPALDRPNDDEFPGSSSPNLLDEKQEEMNEKTEEKAEDSRED